MVDVELEEGRIYVVTGPARLVVKEGEIVAQGANWSVGSTLVVSSSKSIPLYATEKTRLEAVFGEGGSIELDREENPVKTWEEKFRRTLEEFKSGKDCYTVVFLGCVESGKTTATTMMANLALKYGFKRVAVIDGDVGQADIGPPTFISMGWVEQKVLTLRGVEASKFFFIGDITPYAHVEKIVLGTKELVEEAREEGAEVVVVDTDGWFRGLRAYTAKLELLKAVRPDKTFILESESSSLEFYSKISSSKLDVEVLSPPKNKRERSREDRRSLRNQAYTRAFKNSQNRTLSLKEVFFTNFPIGGRELSIEELETITGELGVKVLYGEAWSDSMLIVLDRQYPLQTLREAYGKLRSLYGARDYTIVWKGWEEGLIASILDSSLRDVAPAVVREINYSQRQVRIYTPWSGEVKGLSLGKVRLQILEGGIIREAGKV